MPKAKEPPTYTKLGENLKVKYNKDTKTLLIKVDLSVKGELSQKGTTLILAKSGNFKSIEDLVGEPIAINMVITKRKQDKAKKKKPREDDDD